MPSQNKQLWEVLPPGAWKGNRCFIIGGGPSLRKFNFNLLRGEKVLAINRAHVHAPFADVMFSCDTKYFMNFRGDLLQFKGHKAFLNEDGHPFDDDICMIRQIPGVGWSDDHRAGLYQGGNSGYGALQLAASLGANPIYLLGFDFHAEGERINYHDDYRLRYKQPNFEEWRHDFEFARLSCKAKVINLTPGTALEAFPKMNIDDLRLEAPFVVVTFFTVGTEYENDVKRLVESLDKFGLKYYAEGRPGKVSNTKEWRKNTYYKAEFLRRMLDKFPRSDIVWLDADAVVNEYPLLFKHLDCDIAVHYYHDTELLSGTMFLKNNIITRNVLNLWIHKNDKMFQYENRSEQSNLQDVLKIIPEARVHRLPPEYTKIFDLMEGKAVIEHFQSSRRYR